MQLTAYSKVRDIALDENGDWEISGGDLQLIGDGPAIVQAVQIALEFFQGEWFLDVSAGIPWWQSVMIKNPNPNQLEGIFRSAILAVDGVQAINSLTLTYDSQQRTLTIDYEIQANVGLLPGSVTLSGGSPNPATTG